MNLILIGYRGTGKTEVAQRLALLLGWNWIDADVEVELRAGKSIAAIFADDGEEAFRDLESAVVADLCAGDQTVLALGGGAVLREQNREHLRKAGKVVWLQATPATIRRRMADDPTTAARRPPLTAAGGLGEIEQVLARREPIYQQCADLVVDTEDKTPPEVAAEIVSRLQLTSNRDRD